MWTAARISCAGAGAPGTWSGRRTAYAGCCKSWALPRQKEAKGM